MIFRLSYIYLTSDNVSALDVFKIYKSEVEHLLDKILSGCEYNGKHNEIVSIWDSLTYT